MGKKRLYRLISGETNGFWGWVRKQMKRLWRKTHPEELREEVRKQQRLLDPKRHRHRHPTPPPEPKYGEEAPRLD